VSVQIAYTDPMKFGDGIDFVSERIRGKAITYKTHSPPLDDATGMQIVASNVVCRSQKDLENTFDVSAAMSFGFGLGSISGNFHFVNQHIMTDTSLCFVVKVQVGKLASSLEGAKILKNALSLYGRDPLSFLKTYGDYYVSALKTGGAFYGTIYVDCKDESRKKELAVELEGKTHHLPVLNVGGRGEIKKAISDVVQDLDIRVFVHTLGVTFPEIPLKDDVGKMLELASIFPSKTEEQGKLWIIKAMLMDYESLGLPDSNDELLAVKTQRSEFIEGCAKIRSELLSKIKTINQIRGNPQLYPNQNLATLSKYQKELASLLDNLNRRVRECLNNPRCNTNIDDLKLPKMEELDKIRESARSPSLAHVGSPISDKYSLFKDILGNPISGELSSFDGIGKYRLFNNGAIFWNPDIGSYEIHGPIFQRYQKEGMEKGRLGYPKTDEETIPSGERRNIFERGAIYWRANTNEIYIGIGKSPISYKYEFTSKKEADRWDLLIPPPSQRKLKADYGIPERLRAGKKKLKADYGIPERPRAGKKSYLPPRRGVERSKNQHIFSVGKKVNIKMIKIKYTYSTGPYIFDILTPDRKKGAPKSLRENMTFIKLSGPKQKGKKLRPK
jgi:LGFP repeat